eukprot:snap_masked-scaffold_7-processed-gene-0.22-mRNA-1 protein AED:1.00 eAED:1.00 QI:0/0/0/0/1/1/2/0/68
MLKRLEYGSKLLAMFDAFETVTIKVHLRLEDKLDEDKQNLLIRLPADAESSGIHAVALFLKRSLLIIE